MTVGHKLCTWVAVQSRPVVGQYTSKLRLVVRIMLVGSGSTSNVALALCLTARHSLFCSCCLLLPLLPMSSAAATPVVPCRCAGFTILMRAVQADRPPTCSLILGDPTPGTSKRTVIRTDLTRLTPPRI